MLKYQAVIFDLDGTLTDSKAGIFNCARYALEKMGRERCKNSSARRWPIPTCVIAA